MEYLAQVEVCKTAEINRVLDKAIDSFNLFT